jgi:hypothetical protein
VPRILDLDSRQLAALRGKALTTSVASSEGRALVGEVWPHTLLMGSAHQTGGVTNMELAAAFGADIIVLNMVEKAFDGRRWSFPEIGEFDSLNDVAELIGRPMCINLEAGNVPDGRLATPDNARLLIDQGAAMICLTANPGTGAGFDDIAGTTASLRTALGEDAAIWSGKMHMAGRTEEINAKGLVKLVDAGADGVLLPIPGTVPGVTREIAAEAVREVHARGSIVLGTIGTSQEGSHVDLIPNLALIAKEIGVDAHHIGDAYATGVMDPEFLYAYSVAIRGRRHTWNRMGRSIRNRA